MTRSWSTRQYAERVDALLSCAPVLPVLAIERLEDAVPLARALVDAGLPVLEVTLRTDCALAAIARIVADVPGACVGAGTVLDALRRLNADEQGPLGSFGAVVGATIGHTAEDLDVGGPLLVPGLGAQGGTVADVRRIFGPAARLVLASSSRWAAAASASG